MSAAEAIIGVDLGCTDIKVAAFDPESGAEINRATAPTRDGERDANGPVWIATVRALIADVGSGSHRIGLTAPGLVNRAGTAIDFMPGRLEGLEGLEWQEVLNSEHPIPVLNDAHSALLGEIWHGAAKDMENVVMLTLGTGVGGAIVSDGKLLRGHIGRAGHLGHMTTDFEGAPDICNTPGSIENAIGNITMGERSDGRFQTTHELIQAYADGDHEAAEIWLRSLRALAATIVSLTNILDPEAVILGGGIAKAGEHLFGPLAELLDEREWRPAGHRVRILPAELGPWAGASGAAFNAVNNPTS